jgi:PAS domain S-box-containing protein
MAAGRRHRSNDEPSPIALSTKPPFLDAGGGIGAPLSSEVFALLVEGIRDYAIFMLNPHGIILSWNEGARRLKGYAPEEIIGQHFSKFYPADAVNAGWPDVELHNAKETGRFEDEGWRLRKDGTRFWANVVITALHDASGELLGFSKVTRDLSERRRQEERLKESEENFRLLVEGVRDHAMFLLNPNGVVLSWNAGAERVHGFPHQEAIGHHVSLFYTAEDVAAGKPAAELAIAADAGFFEDTGWRVRRDGTRFWADVTLTALNERDGRLRGYAQIIRDLSERRRVQELETEGRRITEFLAMLAHELRNPLAPIGNAVGILEKVATAPEVVWCTQLIGRQVVHMSRLVDDLLDVSRITSGKIQLKRETLDLNVLAAAAVESVRPMVSSYGHTLELQVAPQPVRMDGDPTRLTQVIVNLVTNAAKYTPNGGRVQVRIAQRGPLADIQVIDNGIGMSKRLIETAFDLFVQGERGLDRSEGGLGIGLTLVKRIVLMHGGSVAVTSEGLGQGSRFTVTLPLTAQASSSPKRVRGAADETSARRILVVDDNEDAASSLAALLQMSGHEIFVAHDGAEALRLAAAEQPELVLLDLGLPGMDGYEVARRIRELPPLSKSRLIAMTGYGRDDDKRAALEAGFDEHLVKPVDHAQLLAVIDSLR